MLSTVKKNLRKLYLGQVLKKEKKFNYGKENLKYIFIQNKKSDKLLVIFSGFPVRGKAPSYNYITKLNGIKMNKLFILDDFGTDNRGSYYLGENKDFFIERAVSSLIEVIREERNIDKNNVITTGSSKGGYASLFFAFKYGYGTSISAAPQYLLGDYLSIPDHLNIMEYITGSSSEDGRILLNKVLSDEIERSQTKPNIYIHVSKNEEHYSEHVMPLVKKLDEHNLNYKLDLAEYEDHGEVGRYFPPFLKKSLSNGV